MQQIDLASLEPSHTPAEPDRRDRILGAAERVFALHGFRGARMQDVAAEAGMSAGNLYRYFTSKDSIVSGLVARDRAAMSEDFRRLAQADDLLREVESLLRVHLSDTPSVHAQLCMEIWAEASRNPVVAELCAMIDGSIRAELTMLVATKSAPGVDSSFVARLMSTLFAGLFKRRATEPAFEADREIALALGVFEAALAGRVRSYEGARQ